LAAAADAVRLFDVYQHVQYLEIGRSVLAGVVAVMGVEPFIAAWRERYPTADPPRLTAQELLLALAQEDGIGSNEAFVQRMQQDPPFKARADELIAFAASQGGSAPDAGDAVRPDDPLAAALAALLQADSDAALAQALDAHPILREPQALFALAGLLNQAQQNETVVRLVVYLVTLLDGYNNAHSEQIEVEQHGAVIDLCEGVIPLAGQIHPDLAAGLRQQAGWACNTLGNHYARDGENQDLAQAGAAYTRGVGFDLRNAMLLRNRAGVHIERRDLPAAQADIEAAAALEPDAPRLAELRAQLAAGEGIEPSGGQTG